MRGFKFKVFKGRGKQPFFYHVRASNGRIVLASEGFTTEAHAHKAVRAVWKGFHVSIGTLSSVGFMAEVPYTDDSLLPKPKGRPRKEVK